MTSSLLDHPRFTEAAPLHRSTELYPTRWLAHPSVVLEVIAPGIVLVPHKQWVSASELDRYHQLPPVEVEVTIHRPIPMSWKDDAACHGMDLTLFFGDDPGSRPALRRSVLKRAREVCITCPVVRDCLRSALVDEERGVWGGTSHRQRKGYLAQIAQGRMTIEDVVDECHPTR